jgi:hypothetical protein
MHTLNVSFTPADNTDYTNVSASVSINVSVLGTFVYTPPSGTVLSAGTDKLNVSFTPTDTANYTTASANVLINVVPAMQALTIQKSASPTNYNATGQNITYRYTITNNGNVDISAPITVADDKFGIVPIQSSGILSPGSSVTGTTAYKITDKDIDRRSVTNLATATGSSGTQEITSNYAAGVVLYEHPEEHSHD